MLRARNYQFMNVYENHESNARPSPSLVYPLACGLLGSVAMATLVHPLYLLENRDIMHRLQQVEFGAWEHFRAIAATEGLNGYFKGYLPNLVRTTTRNMMYIAAVWLTALRYNKDRYEQTLA